MQDKYYHIALSLCDRLCIIVGFGEVGQRKLHGLLQTDAKNIEVYDPNMTDDSSSAYKNISTVILYKKICTDEDLIRADIVFACTNSIEENRRIAQFCRTHTILCNATSTPQEGNFYVPSVIRRGSATVSLDTGGKSPALTRIWAKELDEWLAKREFMLTFMASLREHVLALHRPSKENRALFRSLVEGPLQSFVVQKNRMCAKWLLMDTLPPELSCYLDQYLKILFGEIQQDTGA